MAIENAGLCLLRHVDHECPCTNCSGGAAGARWHCHDASSAIVADHSTPRGMRSAGEKKLGGEDS